MTPVERLSTMAAAAPSSVNDELTIILSGAQLALLELPACHPARALLLNIQTAAIRLAHLNGAPL